MKKWSDDEKWPIWLVWAMGMDQSVCLRAVATSQTKANIYRVGLGQEPNIVRVWIEKREANHAYGQDDMLRPLAMRSRMP